MTSTAVGIVASAASMPSLMAQGATPTIATPATGNDDLETSMLATMDEIGIPGALVLVDSPESGLWTAALGVSDIEAGTPMSTDMHMRVGSIAKTFTATMVLQLVDKGLLTLDDTIATHLPDLPVPNADIVTLRHLLSMRSGIADYVALQDVWELLLTPDSGHQYTLREMVEFVLNEPPEFEPGTQFMYSNTNYMIASMMAEQVTETPYDELIQTNVLDTVGLENTSFPTTPDMPEPASHGYAYPEADTSTSNAGASATPAATPIATPAAPEPVDVTRINPTVAGASGGTVSTLGDLHIWLDALQNGTLLSPELQAERFATSAVPEMQGFRYGLGIMDVNGAIGHDGGIAGFGSLMLSFPEVETTAIVLVNVLPPKVNVDPTSALLQHVLDA